MYDADRRDWFRGVVTAATGVATVVSATATGLVTGLVAASSQPAEAEPAPAPSAGAGPQKVETVWRERPRRWIVERETIFELVGPSTTTLGGGTVAAPTPDQPSGGDNAQPAPAADPAPAPPPAPAPAPAPAPSSGS